MLSKIVLKNFMSYSNSMVELSGNTIAVLGDNGSGKSAFLEAIPYAYYGLRREGSLSGMSRLNGDGSHSVTLYHSDGVMIQRGCTPNGTGFCEVFREKQLIVKGREASMWLEDYMKMDAATFMLTAFFGLRDVRHDTLINVTPSVRLESLQKLSKIGPYREFSRQVKERLSIAERSYESVKANRAGLEAGMVGIPELRRDLKRQQETLDILENRKLKLKTTYRNFQVDEEKYQLIASENTRLKIEKDSLTADMNRLIQTESDLTNLQNSYLKQFENKKEEKDRISAELENLKSVEELEEQARNYRESAIQTKSLAQLRRNAVDMKLMDTCPLCGAEVSKKTLDTWIREYKELSALVESNNDKANELSHEAEKVSTYHTRLGNLIESLDRLLEDHRQCESQIIGVRRDIKKTKDTLNILDTQISSSSKKMGEDYRNIQNALSITSDSLDSVNQELGSARGEIKSIKKALQQAQSVKEKIKTAAKKAENLKKDIESLNVLQSAWSRYGIPMFLIREVIQEIELRATAIYQNFDGGVIKVREIEDRGGKPGVQFFLVDCKGSRTYSQLSEGEKVMFFISVRVAIAQIVGQDGNVDYLILDEALGNLSEKRRDDLVCLIGKVLRQIFPRIIMVTHTEIAEIFTQTLKVTVKNGESKITESTCAA